MAYQPPVITKSKRKLLEIIARGHPERKVTIQTFSGIGQANAISWSEIEIAFGVAQSQFMDSIAHLGHHKLIASARHRPSFIGRLRGEEETHFFWATDAGRKFLMEHPEDSLPA